MFNHITQLVLWLFCCISLCIFTIGISWKINTFFNFGYAQIYPVIAIDKTIKKYAPLNSYDKKDFADTGTLQHISLFEDIVISISHSGRGLAEITYKNKKNEERLLLTKAEIVHLKDVSILVDNLGMIWLINNILLLFFIYYFSINNNKKSLRKPKKWLVLMMALLLILGFSLLGFTRIFYYLHTVVFPDNHQWFFYYEESLMSTLMKAPDIFVVIASLIVLLALPVYILGYNVIFSKKYNLINLIKS